MSYLKTSSLTEEPGLHDGEMWNTFELVSRGFTLARKNGWKNKE